MTPLGLATRLGLGCMPLSHGYGTPPSAADGVEVIRTAIDAGVRLLDTATLYGAGRNEELVGRAIAGRRHEVLLASKGGMASVDGVKTIDGRPATLRRQVDDSLRRLGVDHIDLYYLHRWDRSVPIGDSVGALAELMQAGKIGAIGLSEISVHRLDEARRAAPIAAVQNEFSLWSRNPELGMLDATRDAGIALVAFSPLGRGFLADSSALRDPRALDPTDIRSAMPRFSPEHWPTNADLLHEWREIAREACCSPAQLALAWLLAQGDHVVPIPGSADTAHVAENVAGARIQVDPALLTRAAATVSTWTVSGQRYAPAQAAEVDAESFEVVR